MILFLSSTYEEDVEGKELFLNPQLLYFAFPSNKTSQMNTLYTLASISLLIFSIQTLFLSPSNLTFSGQGHQNNGSIP